MEKINNDELINLIGGINITGVLINAFTATFKFIYDVGRNFGSSIRRISSNNLCPLK